MARDSVTAEPVGVARFLWHLHGYRVCGRLLRRPPGPGGGGSHPFSLLAAETRGGGGHAHWWARWEPREGLEPSNMATSLLRPCPEAGRALAVLKDSGCWAERMTGGPGLQTEHTFVSPEKQGMFVQIHTTG